MTAKSPAARPDEISHPAGHDSVLANAHPTSDRTSPSRIGQFGFRGRTAIGPA